MSVNIKMTNYNVAAASNVTVQRITNAITVASTGTMKNKHGAVLMQSGSVLAVGVNAYRNAPSDQISSKDISIHAEVAASRSHLLVPNTTLYIVRVNTKTKELMDSKPCSECLEHILWKTQIKEVIYS